LASLALKLLSILAGSANKSLYTARFTPVPLITVLVSPFVVANPPISFGFAASIVSLIMDFVV